MRICYWNYGWNICVNKNVSPVGGRMNKSKYSKALTWDELAELYPGKARIKPMQEVFDWAAKQTNKFYVHPIEGTIHLLKPELI